MSDQEFNRLTREQIVEMLPAFVVGALESDEMLAVEEYIHAHPDLMARVRELEAAAAQLAYVAPPQPLPQELHARVMSRARGQLTPRSQPSPARQRPEPRTEQRPGRHIERAQPQPVVRENPLAAWWRRRGLWDLGLVAAVAAALALGIFYRGALVELDDLRRQVQGLEQQIATVQEANETLQSENVRLQSELDTQLNQMASIAGAQEVVALGGTEAAPNASARLYVHDTIGTLVLSNLDQLGDDQTYQLWLIPPDGAPIAAGVFERASAETETLTFNLPITLDTIAAIGVSVEPPGGSAAPTGPIVLLGERA
jgi:anti-sigma-K factor RskA